MTIDEQIEVLKAYKEGKKIELNHQNKGWLSLHILDAHQFNFSQSIYRIVPEPEYVPLEATDLAYNPWLRHTLSHGLDNKIVHKLYSIDNYGIEILFGGEIKCFSFEEMVRHYEMSTDLKTWMPCRKEKK